MKPGGQTLVREFPEEQLGGPAASRVLLAAAQACGFRLAGKHPVDDYLVSDAQDLAELADLIKEGKVTRVFRASFESFKARFGDEEISLDEFQRRLESAEWCAAHPDHPIAYLRNFVGWLKLINADLAGRKPRIRLTRGRRECYLIQEGDVRYNAEKSRQLLEWFEKGWKKS